jgi:hypothetical protein
MRRPRVDPTTGLQGTIGLELDFFGSFSSAIRLFSPFLGASSQLSPTEAAFSWKLLSAIRPKPNFLEALPVSTNRSRRLATPPSSETEEGAQGSILAPASGVPLVTQPSHLRCGTFGYPRRFYQAEVRNLNEDVETERRGTGCSR